MHNEDTDNQAFSESADIDLADPLHDRSKNLSRPAGRGGTGSVPPSLGFVFSCHGRLGICSFSLCGGTLLMNGRCLDGQTLIAEYARTGSECSFRELVTRVRWAGFWDALRLVGATHILRKT